MDKNLAPVTSTSTKPKRSKRPLQSLTRVSQPGKLEAYIDETGEVLHTGPSTPDTRGKVKQARKEGYSWAHEYPPSPPEELFY
jgi:hypothetical protein